MQMLDYSNDVYKFWPILSRNFRFVNLYLLIDPLPHVTLGIPSLTPKAGMSKVLPWGQKKARWCSLSGQRCSFFNKIYV